MAVLINILVWSVVAGAVMVTGCALWCAIGCVGGKRKKRLILMTDYAVGNPMSEAGITVVSCGFGNVAEVEKMMSMEYVFYEVVIVCDSHCCRNRFADLLDSYSMLKVEQVDAEHLDCGCVRGVYRSKERRYKRLVVVDHAGNDCAECFNCGLVLASYDYVIPVTSGVVLNKESLVVFNAALHDLAYEGVSVRGCDVCVGGVVERPYSNGAFSAINRSVGNMLLFLPFAELTFCRGRVFMFRRDGVFANGGFLRGRDEPFCSVGYCNRHLSLPLVVASGETQLCRNCRRLFRVLYLLFWGGFSVAVAWGLIISSVIAIRKLLLLLLVVYLVFAALGALSVAVMSDREGVAAQLRYRSLLSLVLYPIYGFVFLWRTVWR